LPDPTKEQDKNTPGLNLKPMMTTYTDKNAMYCFEAGLGLWAISGVTTPEEDAAGIIWEQDDIRAYVTNAPMKTLYLR